MSSLPPDEDYKRGVVRTMLRLSGLGVAMFAFAMWVMPPLYTLFCEVTGINGKTGDQYQAVPAEVDRSRTIKVKFVAINNEGMPWDFAPEAFVVNAHPGEIMNTHFNVKNLTQKFMVGQAVPSMVPNNATNYFHKTECFCFNRQTLAPGEEAELGLQFIVDQALPKGIHTIILSYSLFDVTERSTDEIEQKRQQLTGVDGHKKVEGAFLSHQSFLTATRQ